MSMGLKVYLTVFHFTAALVKGWVTSVKILGVKMILSDSYVIGVTVNMEHYCHQSVAISTVLFHTVIKGWEWSSTLNKHHCSHSSS